MNNTKILFDLLIEARTRFTNLLDNISESDLQKKILPAQNSVGFLIRHIGDVELLFAKNVFSDKTVKVTAKTIIAQKDTGEWTDLISLKSYVAESFEKLKAIVEEQTDRKSVV